MANSRDFTGKNRKFTGTKGVTISSGTTAQRVGNEAGELRFNTSTNLMEYYNGTIWKSIDSPPLVSSVDVLEVASAAGGNQTFIISGSNFGAGAIVSFIGSAGSNFNASTTTVNNDNQITAVAAKSSFLNAQEPYGVKVENVSGLSNTLTNQINVDNSPTWVTASGTLATIEENSTGTHATVSATDPESDTITYSETGGTVLTTAGLTLNSSTGAISGDPTNVGSPTTYTFTLRATANGKTADRQFSIVVNVPPAGGNFTNTYAYSGTSYRIHKFTSNGNFVLASSRTVDYLIIGGGGGGGHHSGGGGGAGGLAWRTGQTLSAGTYAAVIGSGGATNFNSTGSDGQNSTFNSNTALGGGGGGCGGSGAAGRNGGSGGGGARGNAGGSSTQSSTYGYGTGNGGASTGSNNGSPNYAGYGGGGAGGVGSNRIGGIGNSTFVGDAASTTAFLLGSVAGTDSSNNATTSGSGGTLYIAAGGGGSDQDNATDSDLAGGVGGGGAGSDSAGYTGTTAIANTGSGAGGQGWNGGSVARSDSGATGVVIVRYTI